MRHCAGAIALALLAGACRPEPNAPRSLAADAENHDFALDLRAGRLYYLSGAYPRKSYFCSQDLSGGAPRCERYPGYTLDGPLSPAGDAVMISASPVDARTRRGILIVDARTGALRERDAPSVPSPAADPRALALAEKALPDALIESVAAGERWAYAVVFKPGGAPEKRHPWLRPRLLYRLDASGREAPIALEWTKRKGRLLAVDEGAARLYFAVTDKDAAAAWVLPLAPEELAKAAPLLDGARPWVGAARLALPWIAVMLCGAAAMALRMMVWFRR